MHCTGSCMTVRTRLRCGYGPRSNDSQRASCTRTIRPTVGSLRRGRPLRVLLVAMDYRYRVELVQLRGQCCRGRRVRPICCSRSSLSSRLNNWPATACRLFLRVPCAGRRTDQVAYRHEPASTAPWRALSMEHRAAECPQTT